MKTIKFPLCPEGHEIHAVFSAKEYHSIEQMDITNEGNVDWVETNIVEDTVVEDLLGLYCPRCNVYYDVPSIKPGEE